MAMARRHLGVGPQGCQIGLPAIELRERLGVAGIRHHLESRELLSGDDDGTCQPMSVPGASEQVIDTPNQAPTEGLSGIVNI
jgi:hypothetical protein